MTAVLSMEPIDKCPEFAKFTGIICACIVGILLVAGLAPFHAPKNQVKWLDNKNGLQFRRYSSILSTAAFHGSGAEDNTSESIELWLVPSSLRSTNAIVSFDGSDHPGVAFVIRQYKDAVVVRQHYIDDHGIARVEWLAVSKAFHEGKPVLVSVTLGKQGTAIYLDGALSEVFAARGISTNNLTGRLIVANSPQVSDSWPGQILGLAMYRSQLTPAEVASHSAAWAHNQKPVISQDEGPFALYLFNEGKGNIVHNQLDSASSLIIPEHYFILRPRFLSSVTRDYRGDSQYWGDVVLNIIGFVPLGFFVTIYLSKARSVKHPAVTAVFTGLLISFMIEGLQFFLPTRSSGSTDLITNTLGTAIGVMFYHSSLAQNLLTKAKQIGASSASPSGQCLSIISSDSTTPEPTFLSALRFSKVRVISERER